jgi:hypothetical protein
MKRIVILVVLSLSMILTIKAQAPAIQWQNTIGGSLLDQLYSIQQTSDGGYICGGCSHSGITGDKTEANMGGGWKDYWVVKLNSAGNIIWQNTIGGSGTDNLTCIRQTSDGGYILGGWSDSGVGGDKTENCLGMYDYWVVKLDGSGNIQWQNTIGGSNIDEFMELQQTTDGGYILGGFSRSGANGDKTEPSIGISDYWIVKLNSSGVIQWQNTIGGTDTDELGSLHQTTDGGYILGGFSQSNISGDKTETNQNGDFWVVKIDALGTVQWDNTIKGGTIDRLNSVRQTSDGNYILGGWSESGTGFDKTEASMGSRDYWIVKLSNSGTTILWQNTIGGNGLDYLNSIRQTSDGGYILGGQSYSNISGDKTENDIGSGDYWIVKVDANGTVQWENTIGGNDTEDLRCVEQTSDGGYILGGFSLSGITGDKTENTLGNYDYWVIKIASCAVAPNQPGVINGLTSMCSGAGATTYSIASVTGATSYTWTLPGGWSGSSATNTISATPGSTGIFTVTANNACGTSPQQTLNVTVNPLPTITVNSGSICSGQSFTMAAGGASSYTFSSGPIVSPISNSSYSVTGTSTAGCISSNAAISNVTVNITPTITVNSGSICSGNSFTMVPIGASTYTFQGGNAIVSPITNASYTVIGTSTAGCVSASSATSNITVSATPTMSVNSGSICFGDSFTLVPNGANTYTFSGGPIVSPTTTSSYSVTGTSTAGCVSSVAAISNVTVNPLPTINSSTTNTLLCVGQSATLTASGASSYTFNPGGAGISIVVSPSVTSTYTIDGTDANGCTNSGSFTQSVSTCAGIHQISNSVSQIQVYPNPFNDKVVVILSQSETEILVFNMIGDLIFKGTTENGKLEIDLSKEANGVYFIKTGMLTEKIIKQ